MIPELLKPLGLSGLRGTERIRGLRKACFSQTLRKVRNPKESTSIPPISSTAAIVFSR
jgi:hypothetical protein